MASDVENAINLGLKAPSAVVGICLWLDRKLASFLIEVKIGLSTGLGLRAVHSVLGLEAIAPAVLVLVVWLTAPGDPVN